MNSRFCSAEVFSEITSFWSDEPFVWVRSIFILNAAGEVRVAETTSLIAWLSILNSLNVGIGCGGIEEGTGINGAGRLSAESAK